MTSSRRRFARTAACVLGAALAIGSVALASCSNDDALDHSALVTLTSGQDGPTAIAVDATTVFWINKAGGTIMSMPSAGGVPSTLASNQYNPTAIAIDSSNVYWANGGSGDCFPSTNPDVLSCPGSGIVKVSRAGGIVIPLAPAQVPSAIAVDANSVYWVNNNPNDNGAVSPGSSVVTVPLNGGIATTLAEHQANALGIAVNDGSVYWTNGGYDGSVYKVPVGGGTLGRLPAAIQEPGPMTTFAASLFWLDAFGPGGSYQTSVVTVPISGGIPTTLGISFGGVTTTAGIAADANRVYWTTSHNSAANGFVLAVPVTGGAIVTLAEGNTAGGGIAVDGTSVYWTSSTAIMKLTPKLTDATYEAYEEDAGLGYEYDAGYYYDYDAGYYGGATTCSESEIHCNGICRDPLEDPYNCGGCDVRCGEVETCSEGVCGCYEPYVLCGSECIDTTANDPDNCGGCGVQCAGPEVCSDGVCGCANGGHACGNACVFRGKDPDNCGACGNKCPVGDVCTNGVCGCPTGTVLCGSTCVDEQSDAANCGGCGTTCTAPETCVSGTCACPSGGLECSGACVAAATDVNNCGACGTVCSGATPYCASGTCVPVPLPNCAPGGAGLDTCGAASESCCASLEVPGGTFFRTYDSLLPEAGTVELSPDGGPAGELDPATVSGFRLDKYLVTVGRFRQFVNAWNGGTGFLPTPGSGIHTHLNGGLGLQAHGGFGSAADAAIMYEPGWLATDDGTVSPTAASLACDGSSASTWTSVAGANETLPINCMNWAEAYAFCIWDGGFLPSEAELEYAAAGGSEQREYPWGQTNPETAPGQYAIYNCKFDGCPGPTPGIAPVGTATLGAGAWGQLDLAGEVDALTLDAYTYYSEPWVDSVSIVAGAERAAHGGDYTDPSTYLLASARVVEGVTITRGANLGFRCARTP